MGNTNITWMLVLFNLLVKLEELLRRMAQRILVRPAPAKQNVPGL